MSAVTDPYRCSHCGQLEAEWGNGLCDYCGGQLLATVIQIVQIECKPDETIPPIAVGKVTAAR